ncbi:MAG: hypothetical protein ACRCX2_01110 [Paraclostridium sp.]
MASAYETYSIEEDAFRAKKQLLEMQYANGIKQLKKDLINYKQTLKESSGLNGIDPNSPLISAEMSKADYLENDIETYGASTLSNRLGSMKTNVTNNLKLNMFKTASKMGLKGMENKLSDNRYNDFKNKYGADINNDK